MFAGLGESVIAASLTLAVMTMPVVITSTREALAVPMSSREASHHGCTAGDHSWRGAAQFDQRYFNRGNSGGVPSGWRDSPHHDYRRRVALL